MAESPGCALAGSAEPFPGRHSRLQSLPGLEGQVQFYCLIFEVVSA